ncbi:hypothetical protein PEPS_22030 [Persicobacter psychrovividus]|uniref:Transposase n=1 Tax=Persicobacter psychrovividus TaxID=387638 RepID=A0ABN6LE27_9BACT|nr:hypothetical protein PEPS_22030 [Persicobacter psychrovividus]
MGKIAQIVEEKYKWRNSRLQKDVFSYILLKNLSH